MARMYSKAKGKSGSTKPSVKTKPSWLSYSGKETEIIITKLAKEGKSASEIGMILRDAYGIPDVRLVINKKVTQLIKEKGLSKDLPEDLLALIKKSIALRKHLEKNHKDMTSKRGLQITESKIGRLVKYYKASNVLPADWKYDSKSLRI